MSLLATCLGFPRIGVAREWRNDLRASHALLQRAVNALGRDRVWVVPSCSLLHVPVDLSVEQKLDPEPSGWMAFGVQKLAELRTLADAAEQDSPEAECFQQTARALAGRRSSPRTRDSEVRQRAAAAGPHMMKRASPFPERSEKQCARFEGTR